jgi:hypothetical protein
MSREAFAIAEGRQWIPAGPIVGPANGAGLLREERGFHAYIELMQNPVGLRLHVGWTGALIQKLVNAVAVFNTTP